MPKLGKKNSDRRWIDEDGSVWDSKFECQVFRAIRDAGIDVRRCDERDSFAYAEPKPPATHSCVECGSRKVIQSRIYTADLLVSTDSGSFYVEAKGKFLGSKRALFGRFRKARPDVDVRVVLQSDRYTGKLSSMTEYFHRYLKTTPVHVYNTALKNPGPVLPEEWL